VKIAVISDIHSNIEALKAVLQHIDEKRVDSIVCAGDLVGYLPFPNEVIDLVRGRKITCVMGNYDDAIGNTRIVCGCDYKSEKARAAGEQSLVWTRDCVTEENKSFLRGLSREINLTINNCRVKIVHGSPNHLNEYLPEDTSEVYLKELLAQTNTDVLICGHTHIPYHKNFGNGKHVVNAGSVGKPKHGDPQAVYTVIDIAEVVDVKFYKVQYDFESAARAIISAGLPEEFAAEILTGRAIY
jgi:putative phosphoesterase